MRVVRPAGLVLGVLLFAALGARAQQVQIPSRVPYEEGARIPENIKRECTELGHKLSSFLAQYAQEHGIETAAVASVDPQAEGRVLVVEISDAVSQGNAFLGHRKSMSAHAELFVDGASQGDVDFTRNSGGGFGAGYKGSCAVLGRCAKALGKDLAGWLAEQG